MKIGLNLHPERGVDSVLEEARQADNQGYDSVWLGDHLMSGKGSWVGPDGPDGPLDAFTLMTAVGAVTTNVRLAFSMLNASFRYPAMLAKVIASLDQITKGRVICSIGSGSFPEEYVAYGIPVLEDHDERVGYTRELVELLKELWTNPAPTKTSFQGKHIQTVELPFNPKPFQTPHPPIWIGGESDATVQIVKDLADGWVTLTRSGDPGSVASKLGHRLPNSSSVLERGLSAPDWPTRPMTVVIQARIFVAEDHDEAVADTQRTLGVSGDELEAVLRREIVGTPDECRQRIEQIGETGANYLRVMFTTPEQQEQTSRLILSRFPDLFA